MILFRKNNTLSEYCNFSPQVAACGGGSGIDILVFCCIIEPAGSNSGRARLHSELEREFFLFQVLWLRLSSKERWTAVASLPKGGDGYEEVHRICFSFPFAFDSIYYKSKLAAHVSKYGG